MDSNKKEKITIEHIVLLIFVLCVFVWSGIDVKDTYLTWFLETFPVMIVLPLLISTYKSFRFSTLMYVFIALHMVVLMVGGHYSYAEVPLGYWMEDWFGFTRNNYDKIGHFMQGFTPALVAAEVIRRRTSLDSSAWLSFLSVCVAMTVSALYEIFEWVASLGNPEDTEAFLGTQGYIWDTQTDMFLCLIGALASLFFIKKCRLL